MVPLSGSGSGSTSSAIFKVLFLFLLISSMADISIQQDQPVLNSAEQDSVYEVLSAVNSAVPWRSLFPDDLCSYAPHGVNCDYFIDPTTNNVSVHVTELSFGYVSDNTPNPPCLSNSSFSPLIFTSFKHLRKLFFYQCFIQTQVFVPEIPLTVDSSLQELVFINNPAFISPLSGIIRNMTSLRRMVLTGNGIYGSIPDGIGDSINLEEITLSRNKLSGQIPVNLGKLQNLKILDLSGNSFDGSVPYSVGNFTQLLKLDLSSNGFSGEIPKNLSNLQGLEFMDLSYNRFGNFGIPLFLAEMPRLKEVYLSGNFLGGKIPEIWEKLGGILGIGFSDMGLVGGIPTSMGLHLRNLCYLALDNNKLEGKVPEEFGFLEFIREINLQNNSLSGRVPFSAEFMAMVGEKLRLKGNTELCIDEKLSNAARRGIRFEELKKCSKPDFPIAVLFNGDLHDSGLSMLSSSFHIFLLFWGVLILLV